MTIAKYAQIPLGSSSFDSIQLATFDVHFGSVELVEQHGSTHSTRRARQARHAT